MTPEIVVKKYEGMSLAAIRMDGDSFSYRHLPWHAKGKLSGHWHKSGVLSPRFFALLVFERRIFFLAEGHVFDVSSQGWSAVANRTGMARYEFLLLNGTEQVFRTEYIEIGRSSDVDDMDPHFFVQVVGWLRTPQSKECLLDFWFRESL